MAEKNNNKNKNIDKEEIREWYKGLDVTVLVEVGRDEKSIGEILTWRKGTTIKLDESKVNELSIYLNNKKIGYGSILRTIDGEMDLLIEKIFR